MLTWGVTGTVFLARHGQTVSNADGRYQGRRDSALTASGWAEARATAEALRARGVERLLCSPLGRVRQTARVVSEALGLPVEVDAELTESGLGRWEGLTRQEVDARYPGDRARRGADRVSYHHAGGESLAALMSRARAVAGRLDERTTLKRYLVLYHAPAAALQEMHDATPEQMEVGMKPWIKWAQRCGTHLGDLGTPLGGGQKVTGTTTAPSDKDVVGYSIWKPRTPPRRGHCWTALLT